MAIKLTKNQDGNYEKVELVDAELETGDIVKVVKEKTVITKSDIEQMIEKIKSLTNEKNQIIASFNEKISLVEASRDSETDRLTAEINLLSQLKTQFELLK